MVTNAGSTPILSGYADDTVKLRQHGPMHGIMGAYGGGGGCQWSSAPWSIGGGRSDIALTVVLPAVKYPATPGPVKSL